MSGMLCIGENQEEKPETRKPRAKSQEPRANLPFHGAETRLKREDGEIPARLVSAVSGDEI
jgi:hypothetical protein